ncbi:MAG TPA: metallophosphoesterase family protein [Flavobacterium sp.]|nr:metallophosphoesterase family protein [Flavobacterium sp.]
MNNTYVIGDIHGGLKALKQVLERAPITKFDTLIFLGDYVDGWSEAPAVLDFIIDLATKQNCIFMQGNHEEMLLKWLKKEDDNPLWRFHGGEVSVQSYQNIDQQTIDKHIHFLENLKEYYIDTENRLFVHAGFTNLKGVGFEFFRGMFWWDRTLWETAMAVDGNLREDNPRYPERLKIYKEVFIGHTPVTRFGSLVPMNFANVWNVDTGAAFKGKLSILNVNTKQYWQSDALPDLYPHEKGRN